MANWNDEGFTLQDCLDVLRRDEDTILAMGTAYYEDERDPDYPEEDEGNE